MNTTSRKIIMKLYHVKCMSHWYRIIEYMNVIDLSFESFHFRYKCYYDFNETLTCVDKTTGEKNAGQQGPWSIL